MTNKANELNTLDRINNILITYAYNRADEIRRDAQSIQSRIIEEQPSSLIPNKCLNIDTYVNSIKQHINTLGELEELSTQVYRYNHGLEKSL